MNIKDNQKYVTTWQLALPKPKNISGKISNILRTVAISTLALVDFRKEGSFLRAIYCHNVFDNQRTKFKSILRALMEVGHFVDTDTCCSMLKKEIPIDGKYFHLSFDDGFRNNFTNAAPVLKELRIPAIYFIPSAMIDAGWAETEAYCLNTTGYAGVIELLRWEDVKTLHGWGFDIASHTRTHARFSDLKEKNIREDEIAGSKFEIEKRMGSECKYISWPYGTINDADIASIETTKKAGYHACFGAFRGSIVPRKTDLYRIPRHHFEIHWPLSHIKYFANGNREGDA